MKKNKIILTIITIATFGVSLLSFGMEDVRISIKENNIGQLKWVLKNMWHPSTSLCEIDEIGRTPLLMACEKDNLEMVRLLLETEAKYSGIKSINISDVFGRTPLYFACKNYNTEMIKLLLGSGATIDERSRQEVKGKPELTALLFRQDTTFPQGKPKSQKGKGEGLTLGGPVTKGGEIVGQVK